MEKELPAKIKATIKRFTKDHTLEEAVLKFGLKLSVIKKHKFDKGQRRKRIDDDLKQAIQDYSKTHSTKDAVKYFGVSRATVIKYKK